MDSPVAPFTFYYHNRAGLKCHSSLARGKDVKNHKQVVSVNEVNNCDWLENRTRPWPVVTMEEDLGSKEDSTEADFASDQVGQRQVKEWFQGTDFESPAQRNADRIIRHVSSRVQDSEENTGLDEGNKAGTATGEADINIDHRQVGRSGKEAPDLAAG